MKLNLYRSKDRSCIHITYVARLAQCASLIQLVKLSWSMYVVCRSTHVVLNELWEGVTCGSCVPKWNIFLTYSNIPWYITFDLWWELGRNFSNLSGLDIFIFIGLHIYLRNIPKCLVIGSSKWSIPKILWHPTEFSY